MSFIPQVPFRQQSLDLPAVARLTDCWDHPFKQIVKMTWRHRERVLHAVLVAYYVVFAPAFTSIRRVAKPVQGILARVNVMHR